MTDGSVLAGPVGICDAAGAHSKTVDKTATAKGATKLGDILMTMSFQGRRRPSHCNEDVNAQLLAEIFEPGHRGLTGFWR